MAGTQTVRYAGLKFRAEPEYWLRRLLRFPFYFENTNPSFRVKIARVSDPPAEEGWKSDIPFAVHHSADDTGIMVPCPLPDLKIGQYVLWRLTDVHTPNPGQTRLSLLTPGSPASEHSLYSYQVRPEEQLWLAVMTPLLALGSGVAGFFIERWLG